MDDATSLDIAHQAMMETPDDGAARMRFYLCLADANLFLLLETEPENDVLNPKVIQIEKANYVMVFDRADRLAEFAGNVASYASIAGRDIALMLAGQELGLAVNAGVAPSSIVIPKEGVEWQRSMVQSRGEVHRSKILSVAKSDAFDTVFTEALQAKLTQAAGLAAAAYLVEVTYETGGRARLLAFVGAIDLAVPELEKMVSEVARFHDQTGGLDVGFFRPAEPFVDEFVRVGLHFDMTAKIAEKPVTPRGPGMDPDQPPNLR